MEGNTFLKILVLGNSGVGKSSLLYLYKNKQPTFEMTSTCGLDIVTVTESLLNHQEVQMVIFDTAGQEKYRSMSKSNFKNADGILLVYSVTDKQSFADISRWMEDINEQNCKSKIIIVGNKLDLPDRVVSYEDGKKLADNFKCEFYETTIFQEKIRNEDLTIDQIFRKLGEISLKKKSKGDDERATIDLSNPEQKNEKSCVRC